MDMFGFQRLFRGKKHMKSIVRCATLWVAMSAGTVANAGDTPLYAPAPGWVTPLGMPAASERADGPALVLLDQQFRLADGVRTSYIDQATRISTPEMLGKTGTIVLPWHPAKGDLTIHRVAILRGDETIDAIAGGASFKVLQREQQLEQQFVTGILTATMQVDGLRLGDVLRVTWSATYKEPAMNGGVEAMTVLAAAPVQAQAGRMRIVWPSNSPIQWRSTAAALKPVIARSGGETSLSIPLPLAKPADVPTDAPLRFRMPPMFEATSFARWQDVSRIAYAAYRTDGLIAPDSPLAAEVEKIRAASADPRVRAAMALRVVQDEVRYLFNGLDSGNYVPQTPAQTWEMRRGDCKAKTLLLLAMLHALDVPAEPVLAHIQLGDLLPGRLPSFGAFNHVLVRSVIGGKTLWLDGTTSGTRDADLEDAPRFAHVLPLTAGGSALEAVPVRPQARPDVDIALSFDQRAGIDLPALFTLRYTLKGALAGAIGSVKQQGGADTLNQVMDKLIATVLSNPSTVTRSLAVDENAGTATVTASGMVALDWAKEDENREIAISSELSSLSFNVDRARPEWQTIPVAVPARPVTRISRTLLLPDGGKGFTLKGAERFDDIVAGRSITATADLTDGTLQFTEAYDQRLLELPAADVAAARARIAIMASTAPRMTAPADYPPLWAQIDQIRKTPGFAALSGAYQAAIDTARDDELIEAYRNRAYFRADIYDWRGAIADADKVIAARPDVEHLVWRADMLSMLGDYAAARKDIDAALKIDPSSLSAISRLARNSADRKDIAGGIAVLDERINQGGKDKNDLIATKATLLGEAGRVDDAMQLLDQAIAENPGNPAMLNNRCWLKGTHNLSLDTAIKDCTKAIELLDTPATALDSRALVYFRQGRLDEALADLDAAYRIDPSHAPILFMRSIVRARKGDKAGASADLAGARLIKPMIDRDYAIYGITP